jgi:hypothetical protein
MTALQMLYSSVTLSKSNVSQFMTSIKNNQEQGLQNLVQDVALVVDGLVYDDRFIMNNLVTYLPYVENIQHVGNWKSLYRALVLNAGFFIKIYSKVNKIKNELKKDSRKRWISNKGINIESARNAFNKLQPINV